jgi:TonB family protein
MPGAQSSLDRGGINDVIELHFPAIRDCYESRLEERPGLAGRVVLNITLNADGETSSVRVASSTLEDSPMEACLVAALESLRYEHHADGEVSFAYPFAFRREFVEPSDRE